MICYLSCSLLIPNGVELMVLRRLQWMPARGRCLVCLRWLECLLWKSSLVNSHLVIVTWLRLVCGQSWRRRWTHRGSLQLPPRLVQLGVTSVSRPRPFSHQTDDHHRHRSEADLCLYLGTNFPRWRPLCHHWAHPWVGRRRHLLRGHRRHQLSLDLVDSLHWMLLPAIHRDLKLCPIPRRANQTHCCPHSWTSAVLESCHRHTEVQNSPQWWQVASSYACVLISLYALYLLLLLLLSLLLYYNYWYCYSCNISNAVLRAILSQWHYWSRWQFRCLVFLSFVGISIW